MQTIITKFINTEQVRNNRFHIDFNITEPVIVHGKEVKDPQGQLEICILDCQLPEIYGFRAYSDLSVSFNDSFFEPNDVTTGEIIHAVFGRLPHKTITVNMLDHALNTVGRYIIKCKPRSISHDKLDYSNPEVHVVAMHFVVHDMN